MEETLKKILDKLKDMDNRLGQVEDKTNKIDAIEEKVSNIQEDVGSIKCQQKENTKILRVLEHKADVHKAEMDNLTHDVAELQGGIEDIKSKLDLIDEIVTRNKLDIINLRKVK